MLCFLCGKKIARLRSLIDQQYCCAAHRQEARLASAQGLREDDELEPWSVAKSKGKPGNGRPAATVSQTASIFAFLTVGALLVAALMMPGTSPGTAFPPVSLDPTVKRGVIDRAGDAIGSVIRSRAPVTLRHDFTSGWADWTEVGMRAPSKLESPRKTDISLGQLPALRIWNRSTSLQNYQMEFSGQIEKRSLSWAFRARDEKNYYATKLLITKPGPLPNAGLIRYVVMDGREWDRVQLPLPLTLERGGSYRVRVSIQDDRFITYLNGQVISSWSDKRLHRGGVGFFDDEQDRQKVAWVSLSERDSFLGKMLTYFSLIVMPGQSAPWLTSGR
jgi:hypothetical protein